MDQDEQNSVSVIALRAEDYSPDGKNVIISLTTKYSTAERKYSVPIECFYDLVRDLQRLNALADVTPRKDTAPNEAFIQSELDPTCAE
jgi:hypothetical protein